jgi:trigger factor
VNLESQYAGQTRMKLKRALLDKLDAGHDFPLPPRMVDGEFGGIWSQVEGERERGELDAIDAEKSEDQLRAEYRKIAERRVRLGLVLAEMGRQANVQVTDQELGEAMRQEAMKYGPQAQQIFDLLRQNPNAQAQMRAPIFEEKVVDLVLERAQVTDKPASKDELLAEDDMPEGFGGDAPAKKPAKGKAKAEAASNDAAPAKAAPKKAAKAKVEPAAAAEAAPAKPKRAAKAKSE